MLDTGIQKETNAAAERPVLEPLQKRLTDWALRAWRPAGTAVAVVLALLLTWHVINGRNGLSVWQRKRVEDQQLQKEIKNLQQENAGLRDHIERLKSNPDAIEHEAREKLHYAKPGEVIYALPAQPQAQPATAGK
jgi:cell division protein FtsB